MKTFGLTGNIGCGKSTIASLFSRYSDVLLIDCDQVSKEIIRSGKFKEQINFRLGVDVYSSGEVNLKLIANIIFKQPEKKKLLEEFLHPLVWTSVKEKVTSSKEKETCIVESAIIYETNSEKRFDGLIVATCSKEEQMKRLIENRKMNISDIQQRIEHQLQSIEIEKRANFVINTGCGLEQLEKKVSKLYHKLKQYKGEMS